MQKGRTRAASGLKNSQQHFGELETNARVSGERNPSYRAMEPQCFVGLKGQENFLAREPHNCFPRHLCNSACDDERRADLRS